MSDSEATAAASTEMTLALGRVREMPLLSDFFHPLPRLTASTGDDDLGATFIRLCELLGATEEPLTLVFSISDGDEMRLWLLDAARDGCRLTEESARPPDVEVILGVETWKQIAEGTMSPVEAFGRGRMRVRGERHHRGARRAGVNENGAPRLSNKGDKYGPLFHG